VNYNCKQWDQFEQRFADKDPGDTFGITLSALVYTMQREGNVCMI
jgi:hypothetical protein